MMTRLVDVCDRLYSDVDEIFKASLPKLEGGTPVKEAAKRLCLGRLETCLQYLFDNEFDKFELYTTKNLLTFSDQPVDVDLLRRLRKARAEQRELLELQRSLEEHSRAMDIGEFQVDFSDLQSRTTALTQRAHDLTKRFHTND